MSDFTDQVDDKRRKGIHYKTALESFKVELKDFEGNKKDKILELAKLLEDAGFPKEHISSKVSEDLDGYLSKQYVRKVLGDELKNPSKARATSSANDDKKVLEESSIDEPKKLLIGADGQTLTEDPEHADEESNPIDEIYGGKSRELMKREADTEIQEDKEETLENPANRIPLISDIPPELREKLAKVEEQDQLIAQLIEDRDHAIQKHQEISKKYHQIKGGSKDQEIQELKAKINNLNTILYESNEDVRKEQSYKEIEILKLSAQRDYQVRYLSSKCQKTIFLWVNPKTMEILDIKTDVEQHRIQAIRNREKEAGAA